MARLRATAPAARSVLDGREHDGILDRVGAVICLSNNQTIKRRSQKAMKKRADAYQVSSYAALASGNPMIIRIPLNIPNVLSGLHD
jgi:hypothetical protein